MVRLVGEAVFYSVWTGLSTVLGAMLVLFFRITNKPLALALGISAGVMIAIAYTTLLPTAMMYGGISHLVIGISGAILLMVLLHRLPFSKVESVGDSAHFSRLGFLLAIAIAIHNAPEGAAMGIGFGTEEHLGHTLALAMVIHNIPEGIGLAAPLIAAGTSRWMILLWSLICGATLPIGTWVGMDYLTSSYHLVAVGLIFAATTMLWISVKEVLPQAFSLHRRNTWIGMGVGILFMYTLHLFH